MPFDAGGNFSRNYNFEQDRINGIKIMSARVDGEFDNYAAGLNQTFLRTGAVPMAGALRMGGYGISGLGDGSIATPAIGFSSEPNTGIYRPSNGAVAFTGGGLALGTLNVSGLFLTGGINAPGNSSIGGTLAVTGATTLSSSLAIGTTLAVTGATTLTGALTANGAVSANAGLTANTLTVSGISSFGGDMTLTKSSTPVLRLANTVTASEVLISLDAGNNGLNARDSQIRGGNNGANQTYLSFYTANAAAPVERARIDNAGNLGVGLNNPSQRITAQGAMLAIPATGWSAGQTAYMYVGDTNNGMSSTNGAFTSLFGFGGLSFLVGSGGGTERARIDGNGNLGVGTTSVPVRLVLNAAAAGGVATFTTSAGGERIHFYTRNAVGASRVETQNSDLQLFAFDAFAVTFGTGNAERGRFNTSGNLLIGTTTNRNRLTVAAAGFDNSPTLGSATGIAYFCNSDPNYGLAIGTASGDGHTWLQGLRADGNVTPQNISLNEAGGNVAIGIAVPTQKLHVQGNIIALPAAGWSAGQVASVYAGDANNGLQATNGGTADLIGFNGVRIRANGVTLATFGTSGAITNTNGDELGFRDLPQNARTGAYTIGLADRGKHVYITAGAFAVTIPNNATVAFPIGSAIAFINEDANKTISPAAGVTLAWAGTALTGVRTLSFPAICTIIKVGTNRWIISGSGIS